WRFPKADTAMQRRLLVTALLAATLAACGGQAPAPATGESAEQAAPSAEDAAFADLSERWLDGVMQIAPVYATSIGDHRFDDQIGDLGETGRKAGLDFSRSMLAELDALDQSRLSRANQVDALLLRHQLES